MHFSGIAALAVALLGPLVIVDAQDVSDLVTLGAGQAGQNGWLDTSNNMAAIDLGNPFPVDGTLGSWSFWVGSSSGGDLYLQVFSLVGGREYRLEGEQLVDGETARSNFNGIMTVPAELDTEFGHNLVREGWVFGLAYKVADATIPVSDGGDWIFDNDGAVCASVGSTCDFNHGDRTYSLEVDFTIRCTDFSSEDSVQTGSCTSCTGNGVGDCVAATCASGFSTYSSGGYCCADFSSEDSVQTDSCTSCTGTGVGDCVAATCASGFSTYSSGGYCCADFSSEDSVQTDSCTSCTGTGVGDCVAATCASGYSGYYQGYGCVSHVLLGGAGGAAAVAVVLLVQVFRVLCHKFQVSLNQHPHPQKLYPRQQDQQTSKTSQMPARKSLAQLSLPPQGSRVSQTFDVQHPPTIFESVRPGPSAQFLTLDQPANRPAPPLGTAPEVRRKGQRAEEVPAGLATDESAFEHPADEFERILSQTPLSSIEATVPIAPPQSKSPAVRQRRMQADQEPT